MKKCCFPLAVKVQKFKSPMSILFKNEGISWYFEEGWWRVHAYLVYMQLVQLLSPYNYWSRTLTRMQFESPTPSEAYIHVTTIYMVDHAISNNSSERPHAAVISLFRHITAGVNACVSIQNNTLRVKLHCYNVHFSSNRQAQYVIHVRSPGITCSLRVDPRNLTMLLSTTQAPLEL